MTPDRVNKSRSLISNTNRIESELRMEQSRKRGESVAPVKSADRTLTLLETLAAADHKKSLAELANELAFPRSSLHGLLRTLQRRGWVETDESEQRFGLGVRALLVGSSYVEADTAVLRAQSAMDMLSEGLGETIHLGRLDGSDVVYLSKRESIHPLRLYSSVGRRLPAHATALGKAMLASFDESTVDRHVEEPLTQLTQRTITSRSALNAELESTRKRGFAIDNEENSDGIRCFAVALPAFGTSSTVTDALSVSVPKARLNESTESKIVSLLLEARRLYERTRSV